MDYASAVSGVSLTCWYGMMGWEARSGRIFSVLPRVVICILCPGQQIASIFIRIALCSLFSFLFLQRYRSGLFMLLEAPVADFWSCSHEIPKYMTTVFVSMSCWQCWTVDAVLFGGMTAPCLFLSRTTYTAFSWSVSLTGLVMGQVAGLCVLSPVPPLEIVFCWFSFPTLYILIFFV